MTESCRACMAHTSGYAVRFSGAANRSALQIWLGGDKQTPYRQLDEQTLWVPEDLFPHLIDYFTAHMQSEEITAAPLPFGETVTEALPFLPLQELRPHHEAHWIDDVIAEGRIRTAFQPIMTVQNGAAVVAGYEFLSRATSSDGQVIPPYKMFEAAKLRGRLFALDRVCRIQAMRNAGLAGGNLVFVNFVPTAIYAPEHCLQTTLAEARKTGVNPHQIIFEVVETEEVDNLDHLENILLYYRKHGFRYALDDVGQGFSTLEKVERLKPDFVKLDMHYVQGVADDAAKQDLALTLLKTAHSVGATPLAEGIERQEDWRWLHEAGYELFQGYLFGKPEFAPENRRVPMM